VPVSAGQSSSRAYRGAGQTISMNATPNNTLQRTRVRPAGGRSPLSFEMFGADILINSHLEASNLWLLRRVLL
jgi:hypothetical protein